MSITFECEHCRRQVEAPDAAAGKRGKCPYCGGSSYIPAPVSDEDILPLAPLDEEEERRRRQKEQELLDKEQELLSEFREEPALPLEHREDLKSEDLHHFVVNYCLDLARGQVEQAQKNVEKLRQFGPRGLRAVDDFVTGRAMEPALDAIPTKLLQGYLKGLHQRVSA